MKMLRLLEENLVSHFKPSTVCEVCVSLSVCVLQLQDRLKQSGVGGVTLKWREQPDGA